MGLMTKAIIWSDDMSRIRTRFAPSPTGTMHVGNMRTALYAYLIAKHEKGDFLLRIEDTDQVRLVEGATEKIYHTLSEAGLIHDEGPDKEGACGPYVQSERVKANIYQQHALSLIERGEAYYCFCHKERLDVLREVAESKKETYRYDKCCSKLSKEEVASKLEVGEDFVIRQNNPVVGRTTFKDVIYGEISVENIELDDMILIKTDGYPTYNFANVVDDHLMGITHVVRGNEYLSSSPKYNRLYEAFGWSVPTYVHVPLITDEAHKKLSKRSGHTSYEELIEAGFLKDTVVNFIALLGWSPKNNQEIFTLEELVEAFDYKRINKSPAVFDRKKLAWMNGVYIKEMTASIFCEKAVPEVKKTVKKPHLDLERIALLTQSRIENFNEISEMVDFFESIPDYSLDLYTHKRMKTNPVNSLEVMKQVLLLLETQEDWSIEGLHDRLLGFAKEASLKNGQVLWPLRTILSGKASTPGGAFDIASILGKEETLNRIEVGIKKLIQEVE